MTAALQKPLADEDKIVTRHIHPPIPHRQFDWQATRDGYEPGCPIGWGKTESEAIADLHTAEDEAREDANRDAANLEREANAMEAEAFDCNTVRDRDDLLAEAQMLRRRAWHLRQNAKDSAS